MKCSLLIADDEMLIRRGLEKTLSKHFPFLEYQTAADGREALELCREKQPDIVITDIRMPEMSGLELVKELAVENSPAACIIISGYEEFDYARQAIRYGVENYILKPIDEEELVKTVGAIYAKNCLRLIEKQLKERAKKFAMPEGLPALIGLSGDRCFTGIFYGGEKEDFQTASEQIVLSPEICGIYLESFPLLLFQTCLEEETLAGRLKECLRGIKASLAVSGPRSSWEEMEAMRAEAVFAQEQSLYWENAPVLFYERVKKETEKKAVDWDRFCTCLIRKITLASGEELQTEIEELFEQVKELKPSTHSLSRQLSLILAIVSGHEQVKPFLAGEKAADLQEAFWSAQFSGNLEAIEKEFVKLLTKLMKRIEKAKEMESRRIIETAKAFIETHITQEISLKMVAEHISLNPVYFSALFKRETGWKFTEFVTDKKMKKAEYLLVHSPQKRISDIAWELGYEDVKYFNRVFKNRNQMTPSHYREKNIHEQA